MNLVLRGRRARDAVPTTRPCVVSIDRVAGSQENRVFAVATDKQLEAFCGHSMIVDPQGTVLARSSLDTRLSSKPKGLFPINGVVAA
ncbi:nitrilase-related carbon-nitrogen hydrolase [Acidipropionibacterium timonense]|uniref:nitrilase-related carbon-nitrogen hydrolase n=1 Tax=Acidipropionibacterium timonense TaxID=2161818 RepID=UPI0010324589|nr:nitrilase-related carbon-nitrogen hydrolase [Acidipropionibacterium timonense]